MKADAAPVWKSFHLKSCFLHSPLLSQLHFCLTCVSDTPKQERSWVISRNMRKTPIFCLQECTFRYTRRSSIVWADVRGANLLHNTAHVRCVRSAELHRSDPRERERNPRKCKQAEAGRGAAAEQCRARSRRGQRTMWWNWQRNHLQSELTMVRRFIFNLSDQKNEGCSVQGSPGGGKVMEITSHSFYFCMMAKKWFHWVGRTARK